MSRMRKFHSVLWLKGGCSAPRQSNTSCHGRFAARRRTIGRCQGVLARRIQQLMTVLAQKHKEFARLACAGSNFVFFRGQRNRWVPHRGLLQMGGACSSSLYKSTEPPVMSTLSELRSKQLISVLGDRERPGAIAARWSAHGRER